MAINIKTYAVPDSGLICNDSYKIIQVLNDDVYIFFTDRILTKWHLYYVRKSESWSIQHEINAEMATLLDTCISFAENLIFVAYTDVSGIVHIASVASNNTITDYTTGSTVGIYKSYFVMIPKLTGGGSDEIVLVYGLVNPSSMHYRTFVPSTTTLSSEYEVPDYPEDTLTGWFRFNPTEFDDKVYFGGVCLKPSVNNGLCDLYLLAYDRLADSFFWELCVFKFDFSVDEGYTRTITVQGIATDGDSLHMQIAVAAGSTIDYPLTKPGNIIKRASYIVYKDMLDGEWQRYCRLDDRMNDFLSYVVGGTVSRGNFVMLRLRTVYFAGESSQGYTYEGAYPGANPQTNHYYKNTFKALIDKKQEYYYGFNIPSKNTIGCYVPTVTIYSDDYGNNQKIDYYEMNYAPAPPRPVYLTTGNLWSVTLTPILAANYRGVTKPTKMQVEIYDETGTTKLVDRIETDDNTWFQVLASDNLSANTLYKWRCRFYDECDYASSWSVLSPFYIRNAPNIKNMQINENTQRQTLQFETDEYGKELKNFQVTIKVKSSGETVWTSPIENAVSYRTAIETYAYPIDTHGLITSGVEYEYCLSVTNLTDCSDTDSIIATPVFDLPSDPTNLLSSAIGAYIKIEWTVATGITEYRVYRTIDGATVFLGDVSTNVYNDLTCPMNKTIEYKVCSKDPIAQSAGITGTKKITWNGYGFIYKDSLFTGLTGVENELLNNLSNNVEDFGYDIAPKFETVNANLSLYFNTLSDLKKVEQYREEQLYVKVFEEVYLYKIRECSVDRTRRRLGYLVTFSLFAREML